MQGELAGVLCVTPRYLSDLETGKKDLDTNTSLYKWFEAVEQGLVPLNKKLGAGSNGRSNHVRETPAEYVTSADARHGEPVVGGLTLQDMLSQIRSDLAMIEGGAQAEKRRAYHFLSGVHLPMLAKMMKLD